MKQKRKRISGTFPRFPEVKTDALVSIDEILRVIGHTLDKYDTRKTFSVVTPRGMGKDEALTMLKTGRYEVKDLGRKIEIHIFRGE